MNLRISTIKSKSRRNKVMLYLHQCKQCGLLFERIGKAAAAAEFSWERKFMVDKCDTCKNFRLYDAFG
jgi:hypothetical protein